MKTFTPIQRSVFEFLKSFFLQNDQLPPCHVIRAHFGWASENSAHEHLLRLERHGLIEKNSLGKWKFVRPEEKANQ